MPLFGAVSCSLVKGIPETMREQVIPYSVVGVDGHGFHKIGLRGKPYPVRVIQYGTESAVDTWIGNIRALQATSITYTDDFGDTSAAVFVVDVSQANKTVAIGEGGIRGEISVTVQPVA